jgi:hypothetical protein
MNLVCCPCCGYPGGRFAVPESTPAPLSDGGTA